MPSLTIVDDLEAEPSVSSGALAAEHRGRRKGLLARLPFRVGRTACLRPALRFWARPSDGNSCLRRGPCSFTSPSPRKPSCGLAAEGFVTPCIYLPTWSRSCGIAPCGLRLFVGRGRSAKRTSRRIFLYAALSQCSGSSGLEGDWHEPDGHGTSGRPPRRGLRDRRLNAGAPLSPSMARRGRWARGRFVAGRDQPDFLASRFFEGPLSSLGLSFCHHVRSHEAAAQSRFGSVGGSDCRHRLWV